MARTKVELEGVRSSRDELVVTIAVGEGVARRLHDVRITPQQLVETGIGYLINQQAARALVAAWSDVPLDWE